MSTEMLQSQQKLTSAQLRKIKKPIIEKRRRERINESLNQLKALVLEALDKDENQYNKMEKADILEMTVKHLRCLQRQVAQVHQNTSPSNHSPTANIAPSRGGYKTGYTECAEEVRRYLGSSNIVNNEVKTQLTSHLNSRVTTPAYRDVTPRRDSVSSSTPPSPASSPVSAYSGASRDSFSTSPVSEQSMQFQMAAISSPTSLPVHTAAINQLSNSQGMVVSSNGQVSPILSGHGFVPIVISPMAGSQSMASQGYLSAHGQIHMAQSSASLPGAVIPLYQSTTCQSQQTFQHSQTRSSSHAMPVPKLSQPQHMQSPTLDNKQVCQLSSQRAQECSSEAVWRPW